MLRRDPAKPWFRRRERPNWRLGVPGGRLGGQGQRQGRRFSLGSGGSPEYDSNWRSDKWEIPVQQKAKEFGGKVSLLPDSLSLSPQGT